MLAAAAFSAIPYSLVKSYVVPWVTRFSRSRRWIVHSAMTNAYKDMFGALDTFLQQS